MHANIRVTLTAALLTLALPSAAQAAAPTVSTGGAGQITQTSANVNGTVNPRGESTTYYFQYGTSTKYTSETPPAAAGSGTKGVAAKAAIGGLGPKTRQHHPPAAPTPAAGGPA